MALATVASLLLGPSPSASADGVSVRSSPGTQADGMFLTYVGCEAFFGPAAAPRTRVNLGPGAAPLGRRSFGLVPDGPGTASGPYVPFGSLAGLGASVAVTAAAGTRGASYIWTTAADAPAGHAWRGRASTTVPAGGWHTVTVAALTYEWQLVDLVTGSTTPGGQATPAEFVAAHGDGTGYAVTGFGCDGRAFNIDAVRGGGRTWDFEGVSLATAITASATQVTAGQEVVLGAHVTNTAGRVTGDPVLLQARTPGQGEWRTVSELTLVGPDGWSRRTVTVTEDTEFRWLRPEGEYADAGASDPVVVRATPAPEQTQPPEQTSPEQTSPEQTSPEQTQPGQTAPEQTSPEQTEAPDPGPATEQPSTPAG